MFRRVLCVLVAIVCATRAGDLSPHLPMPHGLPTHSPPPMVFERNDGQAPPAYRFLARGAGYAADFDAGGVDLALAGDDRKPAAHVRMDFVGSRDAAVTGDTPLASRVNVLQGKDPRAWHTHIPTFARVRYGRLYDGIDAVFYGADRRLEYDLLVAPHANPQQVALRFGGADNVVLNRDGDLVVRTGRREFLQRKPLAYQEHGRERTPVDAAYRIDGDRVRLALGPYDQSAPLVIDPVIAYSTLVGGSLADQANGVAVDSNHALYVVGQTMSDDFPTTHGIGVFQAGGFVCKLTPDGSTIVFCTRIGGVIANAVAVDANGHAFVVGSTSNKDFPVTSGAFQTTCNACTFQDDAFALELAGDGASLMYATFLGGNSYDEATAVAVDSRGQAHVAGGTQSSDFPVTPGAAQQQFGGFRDGFVTVLAADGKSAVFSTNLGGSDYENVFGMSLDAAGNTYIAGVTLSANLPVVAAIQPNQVRVPNTDSKDGFFARFDSSGALTLCSYFGGTGADVINAIVPTSNAIYLGGESESPTVPGQSSADPGPGAFLSQLSADGTQLLATKVFHAHGVTAITALAADATTLHATGTTEAADFPTTASAPQPAPPDKTIQGNDRNAFYLTVAIGGRTILTTPSFSTYLGSGTFDYGTALASDGDGGAYIGGAAGSADFPAVNAVRRYAGGDFDGFVVHIVPDEKFVATPAPGDVVVWIADAAKTTGDAWQIVADPSAAGGRRALNPDHGVAKITTPLADPSSYVDVTFDADAGTTYHMWIRAKAQKDSYLNDSAYAQFSDSVDANGNPMWRIGTTSATSFIVESCSGCLEKGWAWRDDGYQGPGHTIRFATSGQHVVRFQQREDGMSIDQIVVSSNRYLTTAPGSNRDTTVVLPRMAIPSSSDCPAGEVAIHAMNPLQSSGWNQVNDETAADGVRLFNADAGAPKLARALAKPTQFFEFTFTADGNTDYRLWLRGKALNDLWENDSVFVQFSDSIDASNASTWLIGTTSSTTVNLEDCLNCGVKSWGWQDNGYGAGALGPIVRFASSGTHTIRVQTREDGFSIDQIVLSAARYLTASPGALKNDTTILAACPTPPLR